MAWLQAYTSQGAPEVSVATTQAISTTEENRRKAEERSRIISVKTALGGENDAAVQAQANAIGHEQLL